MNVEMQGKICFAFNSFQDLNLGPTNMNMPSPYHMIVLSSLQNAANMPQRKLKVCVNAECQKRLTRTLEGAVD